MNFQFDQSEINFKRLSTGEIEFRQNGVLYRSVGEASHDSNPINQRQTYSAPLVCPEDQEYPEDAIGRVVWDIICPDSEDESDACDWDKFDIYFF